MATLSWFISVNDIITGPFTTEQVRSKLASGLVREKSFIWCKGQNEWIALSAWENQVTEIVQDTIDNGKKSIWYIDTGDAPFGPLTKNEMIVSLRAHKKLNNVKVWSVGMENWKSVFDLGEVMESLGISRRKNERAPLMGTVAVTRSNDDPRSYLLRTASISVGGMGLTGDHDLRRGDQVMAVIKSAGLPANLHLHGEVSYIMDRGYAGMRFTNVHPETLSIILDYVKRFNTEAGSKSDAA
jgi:hypothetical protein